MQRLVKAVALGAVALVALAGGYLFHIWLAAPTPQQDAARAILSASLPDLDERPQRIDQWRGKVLVVNFWATWCPPCLKEIPYFVRLQDKLGAEGVQFVGIAIDDRAKVAEFARQHRINYPTLIGATEGLNLSRAAGNRLGGMPFTVILDRKGAIAHVELGAVDEAKLEPILRALL